MAIFLGVFSIAVGPILWVLNDFRLPNEGVIIVWSLLALSVATMIWAEVHDVD